MQGLANTHWWIVDLNKLVTTEHGWFQTKQVCCAGCFTSRYCSMTAVRAAQYYCCVDWHLKCIRHCHGWCLDMITAAYVIDTTHTGLANSAAHMLISSCSDWIIGFWSISNWAWNPVVMSTVRLLFNMFINNIHDDINRLSLHEYRVNHHQCEGSCMPTISWYLPILISHSNCIWCTCTMNGTMSNKFWCSQMQHTQFPWSQHFDSELPIDMMLHEQQIRRVQHYKYLDIVLHKPLYHTMWLDYNQVAVCNSMLVVSSSCKPHTQYKSTDFISQHSHYNDHILPMPNTVQWAHHHSIRLLHTLICSIYMNMTKHYSLSAGSSVDMGRRIVLVLAEAHR